MSLKYALTAALATALLPACQVHPCDADSSLCEVKSAVITPTRLMYGQSSQEINVALAPQAPDQSQRLQLAPEFEAVLASRDMSEVPAKSFSLTRVPDTNQWQASLAIDIGFLGLATLLRPGTRLPAFPAMSDIRIYHPAPFDQTKSISVPIPATMGFPNYQPRAIALGDRDNWFYSYSLTPASIMEIYKYKFVFDSTSNHVDISLSKEMNTSGAYQPYPVGSLAAFTGKSVEFITATVNTASPPTYDIHRCTDMKILSQCDLTPTQIGSGLADPVSLADYRSLAVSEDSQLVVIGSPYPKSGGFAIYQAGSTKAIPAEDSANYQYVRFALAYLVSSLESGHPDLVAVDNQNTVFLWKYDSVESKYKLNSKLAALNALLYQAPGGLSLPASSIAVGDIDGDGLSDVVVASGYNVAFLLNQGPDASGASSFVQASYVLKADKPITAMTLAKVDAGDPLDIIVASGDATTDNSSLQIYLSQIQP